MVAQHRDRANVLSGIKMVALEEGLKKVFLAAKKKKGKPFPLLRMRRISVLCAVTFEGRREM